MARNTGKPSEAFFEEVLTRLGKRAYFHRIADAAEVRGRTGRIGFTRPAPSDYIVTIDGKTSYSEVKSSTDLKAFRFSLLRSTQSAAAVQVIGAGGEYYVYIHSLSYDRWYRIPYQVIQAVKADGKGSISWLQLEPFEWKYQTIMT